MSNRLKMLAIAAAVAAGASSAALAQVCPPGYALYGGVCQPAPAPGYSPGYTYAPNNPVSGAAAHSPVRQAYSRARRAYPVDHRPALARNRAGSAVWRFPNTGPGRPSSR